MHKKSNNKNEVVIIIFIKLNIIEIQCIKSTKILIFKQYKFIDVNSWSNLELIRFDRKSNQPKIENESLFDIINCCVTNGGMRTLRSCLLQPCADPDVINIRLDVVEELINNQAVTFYFIF